MAILSYRGNSLIPAPFVGFTRNIQRTPEGTARQHGWNINISGEIVLWKGSPDETGTFWTNTGYPPDTDQSLISENTILKIFRTKLKAITDLFDQDGLLLIQPQDGSSPIKAQLTINSFKYDPGTWTRVIKYTVEAESQSVIFGTDIGSSQFQILNPPEESWNLTQTDEVGRIFKLEHSISSQAKKRFDDNGTVIAEGWQVARDLILGGSLAGTEAVSKLGYNSQFLIETGIVNLDNFQPYNYIRNCQTDETNGRFSVSETWQCIDPTAASPTGQTTGKAIEELNIDTKFSLEDGLYTVNISGTVTGLEERDPVSRNFIKSRWDNANDRFVTLSSSVVLNLAQTLSSITLNPQPISTTIAKNRVTGVIQWNEVYNNRVGNSNSNYLTEIIEVEFLNAADVFASIGVLNRPAGPILQSIGSTTQKAMTINIGITVPTSYGNIASIPITDPLSVFLSYIGTPSQLFLASDIPRWNFKQGKYSRSTTYVYQ